MKLLCVLPIVTHTYAQHCVESLLRPDSAAGLSSDEILVVDNTRDGSASKYGLRTYRDSDGHNIGVGRAWNVGAREVLDGDHDYLLVMSASMQFGPIYQTTWRERMEVFNGARVIECDGHSLHLAAFHRTMLEKVGLWDPAFWPAYHEATDWGHRAWLLNLESAYVRCWVNARSQSVAGHLDAVHAPAPPLLRYYRQKWNGDKGEEGWTLPWGDKPIDYIVEEPIPVLAERYGFGPRGDLWW